mgnify:CR=1 FL=1
MKKRWYKIPLAVIISASMIISSTPVPAMADTSQELQSQLSAAQSQLDSLYAQAEQVSEELNETKVQLDNINNQISETQSQIDQKQQELTEAQTDLKNRISDDYTAGSGSLLDIVVSSSSIEELTSSIYYANKVSEAETRSIRTVRDLQQQLANQKSQLEDQKRQQEELLQSQQSQQADLQSKTNNAQAYVSSLSSELQQALAQEEAACKAAAEQAAREAAAAAANAGGNYVDDADENAGAAARGDNAPATADSASNDAPARSGSDNDAPARSGSNSASRNSGNSGQSNSGKSSSGGAATSNSSASKPKSSKPSSSNAGWRNTVVAAAYSMVGGSYVWGACSPSAKAFDCSGLVKYCYAVAGYNVSHSSRSLRAYCSKPASQAVAGDIVWRPGHVGICIGGGKTIEAMSPSQGVTFGSTSSFSLAGSPA